MDSSQDASSLERYRRLLPPDANVSDEDLARLRDQLSGVARAICAAYSNRKRLLVKTGARDIEERIGIEERAAILEFDGKLPRQRAEAIALADLKTTFR